MWIRNTTIENDFKPKLSHKESRAEEIEYVARTKYSKIKLKNIVKNPNIR